jgi:hypothetical protein
MSDPQSPLSDQTWPVSDPQSPMSDQTWPVSDPQSSMSDQTWPVSDPKSAVSRAFSGVAPAVACAQGRSSDHHANRAVRPAGPCEIPLHRPAFLVCWSEKEPAMPRPTAHPSRPATAILAAAALTLAATLAHAQMPGEVIIEIDRPVLAPGESTTVRLWAGYDSTRDFAMGVVATSLLANSGGVRISDAWSDVALAPPMDGTGSRPGVPDAGGFADILAWQFHWWQDPAATDRSDPIVFWEATFTAPLESSTFEVELSTRTTQFDVWYAQDLSTLQSRLAGLTEGSGQITVIPAPASAVVLLGVLATRRRR